MRTLREPKATLMAKSSKTSASVLTIQAYRGDAKTLLAFNLPEKATKNLAGFTICCKPGNKNAYYLFNKLQYAHPNNHAQNLKEPAYSSINAPIQKFRWLHVPGSFHQDNEVFYGIYTYEVTPRYFNEEGNLMSLDNSLTATIKVEVNRFAKGKIALGFTRGFVQSQAFEHHFGKKLSIKPAGNNLLFNTKEKAGENADGVAYTYLEEYTWSGFTAREKVFELIEEVQKDSSISLDVFAYDFNEPDIAKSFISLARQGRIRMILDNAPLHKSNQKKTAVEDEFETVFTKAAKKGSAIIRGKFGRFAHDKIFILKKGKQARPYKLLTGSTNFSTTGMYVNSNHVIVFNDPKIAKTYADIFEEAWNDGVKEKAFVKSGFSNQVFDFGNLSITFSPHEEKFATKVLTDMSNRIKKEKSSVFFAVMDIDPKGTGPVFPTLRELHENGKVFSYGISDNPGGIFLYKPSSKDGVLITAKPKAVKLPPPFDVEVSIGLGHQVHHKFVVCGFNTKDAVVYCGSSNLALGGEKVNGDNLIAIHDKEIATAFAIEAISLVDHFHFRNTHQVQAGTKEAKKTRTKLADKTVYLQPNDKWTKRYYVSKDDLYYKDRVLFG